MKKEKKKKFSMTAPAFFSPSGLINIVQRIFFRAGLAQSVERGTFNPEVKGSSPLFGETFFFT